MKRIARMGIGVAAVVALTLPTGAAVAAPGDHGKGAGGCVDEFHGNATNPRPSGHGVLPSQSPGPWVNNTEDPDNPTMGTPLGQWVKMSGVNPSAGRGLCGGA